MYFSIAYIKNNFIYDIGIELPLKATIFLLSKSFEVNIANLYYYINYNFI